MVNLEKRVTTLEMVTVRRRGLYFTPTFSLGELIMITVIAGMALWALGRVMATNATRHELSLFEATVTTQLHDLRSTVDSRFTDQKAQLLALPTVVIRSQKNDGDAPGAAIAEPSDSSVRLR